MHIELESPKKLEPFFQPARYKIAYGGRGGAKSWFCARALLIMGMGKPLRILCAREIQHSIQDSVHQLLRDQITALGLESFYTVLNNEIRGINGTTFLFAGLKHNIGNLKSKEGIDLVWIEEAQTVSKLSWDTLIPTIRKEGSEIWVTFNPDIPESETYQRFVVHPPKDAVVIKINYTDNPWFPDVLRQEMEYMRENDPKAYDNVWMGNPKMTVDGSIFGDLMTKAEQEGRITKVPYNPAHPVDVFYDLGRNDKTALWFVQTVGLEYRLLRYMEDSGKHFSFYIKYCKELPYAYGTHYLPHDGANENIAAVQTPLAQAQQAFSAAVTIPRIPRKFLAINAARGILDRCVFDAELCADGIACLRRHAYKVDPLTGAFSKEPDHDTPWSHGADALMQIGQLNLQVKKPQVQKAARQIIRRSGIR